MMPPSAFLRDTFLPDLGAGSGVAIWGFRACALGHARCCTLVRGFEHFFGACEGGPMLSHMLGLARIIGNEGRRKVRLAMPGCVHLTHDEASLLSALSAAQVYDLALRDAHLSWLLGSAPGDRIHAHMQALADAFDRRAIVITAPAPPACEREPGPTGSEQGVSWIH